MTAAPPSRDIILGGTGLLGQAIASTLAASGTHVTAVARHEAPAGALPDGVTFRSVDVDTADDGAVTALLAGHDALVYALGPDDRSALPRPAANYLQRMLVERTERIVQLARAAGVRRAVILGSYFTTWNDQRAGFASRHAYVAARVAQMERAFAAGGGELAVSVLEIPWVFGVAPGVPVMWKEWLFERTRGPVAFFPRGGTTVATARTVARAAAGALAVGQHGVRFPVGDADLTWREILSESRTALGVRGPIVTIPRLLAEPVALRLGKAMNAEGGESGITPRWLMRDIMYQEMFVDHARTREVLGIGRDDVRAEIRLTAREAYSPAVPVAR